MLQVLPAHAGVILYFRLFIENQGCITRTCGGDPWRFAILQLLLLVLPAHAGVIP